MEVLNREDQIGGPELDELGGQARRLLAPSALPRLASRPGPAVKWF